MTISIPEFMNTLPSSGYTEMLMRDYLKHGHKGNTDRFAKRVLAGEYGYDIMVKFRNDVVIPLRLASTEMEEY